MPLASAPDLRRAIDRALGSVPITDIHTHLYAPAMGDLLSWGIDELLTYHYLIAEYFLATSTPYEAFWKLPKKEQADAIWKALFVDQSPLSEATRGVVTVLQALGLDPRTRNLASYRKFFASQSRDEHIGRVFALAGVRDCVMTNDPFDDAERPAWQKGTPEDARFKAALRIDPILLGWDRSWKRMHDFGYRIEHRLTPRSLKEVQRFLRDWVKRTSALYVGVSLPPAFAWPDSAPTGQLLERAVLPVCAEFDLPLAMMIGVRRQVNPELRMAGDGMGRGNVEAVENLAAAFPKNKFMVTMLSRENQHQLCVAARKFRNVHVFGCWWFVNNPSIIEEITRERLELLGPTFTAQHSDARVLDQVIYKWAHSKKILSDALQGKYLGLLESGWELDEKEVERDVAALLGGNFWRFVGKKP